MSQNKKRREYVPVEVPDGATLTSEFPPSDEAVAIQRAGVRRSEDERLSLRGVEPVDVLRTMLATPPLDD